MIRYLQGVLARTVAVAAILFGAVLAALLAVVTLVAGLVLGLFVTVAAWFGARSRTPGSGGPFGRPGAEPEGGRDRTVIDVEMREIPGGDVSGSQEASGREEKRARPDADADRRD